MDNFSFRRWNRRFSVQYNANHYLEESFVYITVQFNQNFLVPEITHQIQKLIKTQIALRNEYTCIK